MSKLGIHIRQGSRTGYREFARAKPAVCLFVDQDPAETEQESGGHTYLIYRADSVYGEAPPGYTNHPDPAALARQWWPSLKAKWQLNRANFYQISNEQGGGEGEEVEANLRHLVLFEAEIMRLANLDDFKVCVLNLATGSPGSIDIWKRVCAPFVLLAWQSGNIYGRHVYGDGDLVNPDGSVIIGGPSRPFEEVGYLRSLGAAGGVVLTEVGVDGGFDFAGVARFTRQLTGYEKLLWPHPEFIGCCGWTTGRWLGPGGEDANCEAALPALTQYLIDNPFPKWQWPTQPTPGPTPEPPPANYLHIRLTASANIRRDASTRSPGITPQPVKEGLELIKVGDVTGQVVGGDGRWIKAAGFISRPYVTDTAAGKVKTNRPVNLRVVPTTQNNTSIVTLPAGLEFESLGNVSDLYNSGLWTVVALYIWRPLAIDVEPGIRLGSPLRIPLTVTSPFGSPRRYPFEPTKKPLHEGLDWHTGGPVPVLAMEAGVVDSIRPVDPGFGYGLRVRIKHSDRYTSWYGHLSEIQVTVSQPVAKGQQIGLSGRSGGSVHHLHCTLQDVPLGLDGYVIDNCCDFTLLMHPAVKVSPSPIPVPEPGGRLIDLREFKIADLTAWRVVKSVDDQGREGQEDVQDMLLAGGFYVIRKNNNGEWRKVDNNNFYLVHDTSPAPDSQGNDRVYTLYKGNVPGAPKSAVQQRIGERWAEQGTHRVQFRARDDCRLLAENSGIANNSSIITGHERNYRFNGFGQNLVIDEVVIEQTGVEKQFYGRHNGKSLGWIGWVAPWGFAEPVEIHFDRGRLTQEPPRHCNW